METKYQVFYPGQYSPEEKEAFDRFMEGVKSAGGVGRNINRTVKADERDMLSYAAVWNRWDPLYNDKEYAAKSRWGRLPAMPCYIFNENITGFPMMDDVGDDLGNVFYYANDGGDITLHKQVYAGDELSFQSCEQDIREDTPAEGSTLRQYSLYGMSRMYNQKGELVGEGKGYARNAVMRITEGYVPTDYEQTYEWVDYLPPVHVTTDEEWKKIKEFWKNEEIRGAEIRWWDDVQVGDKLTPVCSGPVSDLDMMRYHADMINGLPDTRQQVEEGWDMMTDAFGQKLCFMGRHFSYCRNPKARAVLFNFTGRNFILRMVSNWMGDDGFIHIFKWRFQNLFKCMSLNEPGKDILARVPGMEGKFVNRHGMEGDTCICRGEVVDKYEKDGKHYVDIACWGETFDGDIIQVMEVTVELMKK